MRETPLTFAGPECTTPTSGSDAHAVSQKRTSGGSAAVWPCRWRVAERPEW